FVSRAVYMRIFQISKFIFAISYKLDPTYLYYISVFSFLYEQWVRITYSNGDKFNARVTHNTQSAVLNRKMEEGHVYQSLYAWAVQTTSQ
ncbi:unnamed protein product, partial [marine sediment metagenome]